MKKNKKGFTLVELVIVVAVMAVLIAVAIPTVTSITQTAKETVAQTNARTVESTLKLAEANKNKDGDTVDALTPQDVFDAIYAAKLGITEGTYAYDLEKGTVVADVEKSETPVVWADGMIQIVFSNSGNGLSVAPVSAVAEDGTITLGNAITEPTPEPTE